MNRRDALKTLGGLAGTALIAPSLIGCDVDEPGLGQLYDGLTGYPDNFSQLSQYSSWRSTWTCIVAGRFTSSSYSGLLMYDGPAGTVELYSTDGAGHISLLHQTTGMRTTFTHVVLGRFTSSSYASIFFYDRPSGYAELYTTNGAGILTLVGQPHTGLPTWTHLVPGFYTDSPFSGLFVYDQATGAGQVLESNGSGQLTPRAPSLSGLGAWTHVASGQWVWNSGTNDAAIFSHLLFYNASTGATQLYFNDRPNATITLKASAVLAANATHVIAANFGGNDRQSLLLYNGTAGTASLVRYLDGGSFEEFETLDAARGLPAACDLVAAGNFWMSDPEDQNFQYGPSGTVQWQIAAGSFASLMFYRRSTHTGSFFLHEPPRPDARPPIEGYITSTTMTSASVGRVTGSVLPGETIDIHISSAAAYTISILRPGIDTQPITALTGFPAPQLYPVDRLGYRDGVNATWPAVKSFQIPASWASGLYVARIQSQGVSQDLPFVVRAAAPGSASRLLVVIADANYEAYNFWGGRCLYGYATKDVFNFAYPQTQWRAPYAFRLSFERPQAGLVETANARWTYWEVPMIRWLTQQGIPFEVCTDRDLEFNPPRVEAYRLVIFPGHHEYWSQGMRDAIESFTDLGGNVAFLCGNTCWWRVRFENNGAEMVCYKQAEFDPDIAKTINWISFDSEAAMTGLSYAGTTPVHADSNDYYELASAIASAHWSLSDAFVPGTTQFGRYLDANGDAHSVTGTESDQLQASSPATFQALATVKTGADHSPTGTMGVFTRGGGTVFNAAVLNWVLGLGHADLSGRYAIDIITRNVIHRLGVQPFHGSRAAVVTTGHTLAVVARTSSTSVYWARQTTPGGSWGPWSSIAGAAAAPALALNQDGHLELFTVELGQLYHRWTSEPGTSWSGPAALGAPGVGIASRPVIAHNLDGRLEAFVRGADGAVWHAWQAVFNGPWSSSWASLGGSITGLPAVTLQLDGRLIAFARGTGGDLLQCAQGAINGPWAGWSSLGGALANAATGSIAVGRNLNGTLVVFAVLATGQLAYRAETTPGTWGAWTTVAAAVQGTPAIGLNQDGHLEVFAVDSSGMLGHAWQLGPNGAWSSWQSFGLATISQSPDVGVNYDGALTVVYVVTGGLMRSMSQLGPNGAWATPVSLGALAVVAE